MSSFQLLLHLLTLTTSFPFPLFVSFSLFFFSFSALLQSSSPLHHVTNHMNLSGKSQSINCMSSLAASISHSSLSNFRSQLSASGFPASMPSTMPCGATITFESLQRGLSAKGQCIQVERVLGKPTGRSIQ